MNKLFTFFAALICATATWAWSGTGTSSDPYQISSVTDWESLATSVKNGNAHAGEYFVLTTDIGLVTTMVGQGTYPFSGTFDGGGNTLYFNYIMSYDYVAPFRYVKDATIKNLKVEGTINTSAKFAAGLVGLASGEGTTTIENCRISIWILSTVEGDGSHGGLVAHNRQKALNITGCVFDGKLSGENTTNCGGFVGWNEKNDNAKTNIKDCLFKPNEVTVKGQKTFARTRDNDMSYVSISNSYYTSLLGDAQGKQAFTVTGNGVTVAKAGTPTTYSTSGISVYGNNAGFMYDGVIYGGNGDAVKLTLSGSDYYAASTGTLRGFINPYTLTMASANAVVSVGTAPPVTIVKTESELRSAVETDGAFIRFANDIKIGSILEITGNRTLAIDLNNFTLDRGCTSRGSQVIVVRSGSTLNLSNGTVTGGWGGNGGALDNEGTTYLDNITITGNTADDRGGGIGNRSGGILTMTGCTITGNTSNDNVLPGGGGGIFNAEGATLTINDGCSITGNTTGGLYNEGTLNMQGEITITDNMTAEGFANNVYLRSGKINVLGSLAGSRIGINKTLLGKFTNGYGKYNSTYPTNIFSSDVPDIARLWIELKDNEAEIMCQTNTDLYYCVNRSWDAENKKIVSSIGYPPLHIYVVVYNPSSLERKQQYDGSYKYYLENRVYAIPNNVTIDGEIEVKDGCHPCIILCDGVKLTIKKGIRVFSKTDNGCSLNIYGQLNNTGTIYARTDDNCAALGYDYDGSGDEESKATINIYGGTIDGVGSGYAPVIGGSRGGVMKTVNIYGGIINAQGGWGAAAIGSGGTYPIPGAHAHYICLDYGNINIYGGKIYAKGGTNSSHGGAGIGGGEQNERVGNLHIYGGDITAIGGYRSAGIGCGSNYYENTPGNIVIDGGTIVARGDAYAAGIGGGIDVSGTNITINGGHVEAYGGVDAAGIGGGEDGDGGNITITGGYVYAQGNDYGAGIGGGEDGEGGNVTITGGTVIAKAGRNETGSRAIGPGAGCNDYGQLTIGDQMMVTAERTFTAAERKNACWYRTQARIEPCTHENVTYTIDGTGPTDHHLKHCLSCTTTFTKEQHDFANSSTCRVCGAEGTAFIVKIYLPMDKGNGTYDGQTYDGSTTYQMVPGTEVTLPACPTIVPGLEFVGWEVSAVSADPYESSYTTSVEGLLSAGDEYSINGSVSFVARYNAIDLTLYDNADNGEVLSLYDGRVANSVNLAGRTLKKNGDWNTLCLPFDVDDISGTPLDGATVKTLTSSAFADGTLTLNFSNDNLTSLVAGEPYIVKWDTELLIDSEAAWNTFAENVNSGTESYKNKIVRLSGNISVSTMVGSSGKPFKGTFEGQGYKLTFTKTSAESYCAPFRYVDGATIKDLDVAGTINAGHKHAAGLIAYNNGNTTVSNCRISITINSTLSGDGTYGGVISHLDGGAVTINNCLFDGTLSGSSTTNCGGFVGWTETNNSASVTIINCLFNPAAVSLGNGCKTFARVRNVNPTITNSYYRKTLGDAQGINATKMSDEVLLGNLGSGWEMKSSQIVPKLSSDLIPQTFSGVTIDNTEKNVETDYVDFAGSFSPVAINGEDRTMLYMGAGNTLYYPNAAMTIKACRAYFQLKGITVGDVNNTRMYFGDEEADGINGLTPDPSLLRRGEIYNISGQRLSKPQKGINIINGRKVLY